MADLTSIAGRPIRWTGRGSTHIVEGADVHPNVRLLWTLCQIDVPGGKAFLSDSNDKMDCSACVSVEADRG